MTVDAQLAIIGGGQLGMFLSQAAKQLGISTLIVTPDRTAPALTVADNNLICDLREPGLARMLADRADVVTFEFEDVPDILLDELEAAEKAGRLVVRPAVGTLRLLKNKAAQKRWLAEQRFPTLPFSIEQTPRASFAELTATFGLPFVQKAQTGGYDGYGVQVVGVDADAAALWDVPSVIEQYLERPTELGVVVARSVSGDVRTYPPVRMAFDHERNILDAVVSPAGLSAELESAAVQLASELVSRLEGIGVFAVEMFLDAAAAADDPAKKDRLVVNEISPRVHNSGHLTLDTDSVSQFEQHVRAVCGLPLGAPECPQPAAVMRNLLYSDKLAKLVDRADGPLTVHQGRSTLYWYGKREAREGRKMGHITTLTTDTRQIAANIEQLIAAAESLAMSASKAAS